MCHADEFLSVCRPEDRRARKSHACAACSETIGPGEQYRRWFAIVDGEPMVTKQCWRCYLIWTEIAARTEDPVLLTLDCEASWADVFGEMPPEVEALAFALPGEVGPGWTL